jgi:hypothetical protein
MGKTYTGGQAETGGQNPVRSVISMKKLLLYVVMVVFPVLAVAQTASTPAAAPSQSPAGATPSRQEILKLFELLRVRQQTEQVIRLSMQDAKDGARETFKTRVPQATEQQLAHVDTLVEEMFRHVSVDHMIQDMIPVYQKHLTRKDINAIVAFYSTPIGQKLIRELPGMTQEAMQVASSRMQEALEEPAQQVDEKIQQMIRDARKPGSAPEPPTEKKPN